MALLFIDGFDAGDMAAKWTSTLIPTISASTRFGVGRSVGLGSGGNRSITKYFPASAEIYIGFAVAGITTGFNNIAFMYVYSDSGLTPHIVLATNTNGSISVRRNATQIAVTSAGLVSSGWRFLELYVKVDSTVGSVELRADGVTVASFTGNTRNGGTSTNIDGVMFHNSGTILGGVFDDLYILDSTGPAPYNTFLGDVRIHTSVPTAAGNSTQLTPSAGANYAAVDELPYSATDYVSSSTVGLKDTYVMSDIPTNAATVFAVQTSAIAKKTDAGNMALKTVLRAGGTDYASSPKPVTSGDVTLSSIATSNPATSNPWSAADVNNLEAGVEVA